MWSAPSYKEDNSGNPVWEDRAQAIYPCGGGFEYLHRSPVSRRRRWKGSPVPAGYNRVTLFQRDINMGTWPSRLGGLDTVKCGHESRATRTGEWLHWRGPAAIVNYRPITSSEGMLHKDYDRKCSHENNTGRESQGACRQDELINGKSSVVK
jgi:hypothetical protein